MEKILITLLTLTCTVFTLSVRADNDDHNNHLNRHNEATVAKLQQEMASGRLTSVQLTLEYIARIIAIDQHGPGVNSVIELNPDALKIAAKADHDRRHGHVHGPLHGIPILIKDNIDTGDKMQTSAGSFALVGKPALQDSTNRG
jgi:amidase